MVVLGGILFVIALDLGLRYFAFKRLESAAIDAAIFSAIYCGVELARAIFDDGTLYETQSWAIRIAVAIACLVALILLHRDLEDRLGSLVEARIKLLERQQRRTRRNQGHGDREAYLDVVIPVLKRSVLLTFSGPETPKWIREGKRNWRTEVAELLNFLSSGQPTTTETDLLLPRMYRYAGAAAFFLLAAVAIVTPAAIVH